ncbi:MAG: hypothetical protein DMF76_08615 [Acidobacteria bacterium]|nr:MAG: hypothetical protein DMF76_08615 [Acidobacteriota bacterium]
MLDSPFGRFVLRLGPLKGKIGEDEYLAVCQLNEQLVIERNQEGDWEIQSLNGAIDSLRNAALTRAVADWAKKDGTGIGFGAFTGFTLPSGAVRAPDHAWIRRERWETLSEDQKERFAPFSPDFVVEVRGKHECLKELQAKLEEYMANGSRLGWLLDPEEHTAYVYRERAPVKVLKNAEAISGEPLLRGLTVDLTELWNPSI